MRRRTKNIKREAISSTEKEHKNKSDQEEEDALNFPTLDDARPRWWQRRWLRRDPKQDVHRDESQWKCVKFFLKNRQKGRERESK